MGKPLIEFNNIEKQYGYHTVLNSVSGKIFDGDRYGLFGPNGSGKSTLLAIIAKILKPSRGTLQKNASTFLLAHKPMFYSGLSALKNLQFIAKILGQGDTEIKQALEYVSLWSYRHEKPLVFSRGMLQRLMIARLIIVRPQVILFDEPFTGLDKSGRKLLMGLIAQRGVEEFGWKFRAMLIVEHDELLLKDIIDRSWEISKGKLNAG